MEVLSRGWIKGLSVLAIAVGISIPTLAQDAGQSGTSGSEQSATSTQGSEKSATKSGKSAAQTGDATQSGEKAAGAGALSAADRRFVMEAARGSLAEVELGQIAASKGNSDAVKQFGQQMVDDHSKANEELKSIAQQKGLTLPTEPKATEKQFRTRLEKQSGDAFDRMYMQHMVRDHKEDIALFRKASQGAKDEDLKNFAGKALPTLEGHLKMAQDAMMNLGGAAATKGVAKEESPKQ